MWAGAGTGVLATNRLINDGIEYTSSKTYYSDYTNNSPITEKIFRLELQKAL